MAHGITMITTAATIDVLAAIRSSRLSPGFACSPTRNVRHVNRPNHARDALRRRSITHEPSLVTIPDRAPAFVRVLLGLQAMSVPLAHYVASGQAAITNAEWTIN
jgi:hypothetical protein